MQTIAIILAGGVGTRTNLKEPKQYFIHDGLSILEHLISRVAFFFDQIFIVNRDPTYVFLHEYGNVTFVSSGATRLSSIQNGIQAVNNLADSIVMIHDAARPMIGKEILEDHMRELKPGWATISVMSQSQGILIGEGRILRRFYSHKSSEIYQAMLPQFYYGSDLQNNITKIMTAKEDLDIPEILQQNLTFSLVEVDHQAEKITYYEDIKRVLDATNQDS